MTSKKIYLIRHGQTDYNKNGLVQGSGIDAPLNEEGFAQARAFFEAYKHIKFDKVYTSTLQRSIQSVQGFLDLGIPHERFSGLNEINWGNKEGVPITPNENEYYQKVLKMWLNGDTHVPVEGGECPLDVQNRQKPVLDYILSKEDEKTILICMHGRAMRILLCIVMEKELSNMDSFEHSNLGLYLLSYSNRKFTIERPNDVSHLERL